MPEFEEKIEKTAGTELPEPEKDKVQPTGTPGSSSANEAKPLTLEDISNFLKQPGFFELLYLGGLIETVTTIPTHVPSRFEQQFKIYVDSVTAPTVKTLYVYSNKTNTWLSVSFSDLTAIKFIVQEASGLLSAEQSLGALTTGLLKNTVSGSVGTLSTATPGTDYVESLVGVTQKNYVLGENTTVSSDPIPMCIGEGALAAVLDINATGTDLNFGGTTGENESVAQKINESSEMIVNAVRVRLKIFNSPTDTVKVAIQANSGSAPSGVDLASGTVPVGTVGGSYAQLQFILNTELTLTANTTYWVVVSRTGSLNATNKYTIDTTNSNPYANGDISLYNTGAWNTFANNDIDVELQDINKLYKADANDADRDNFIGFLSATGTAGDNVSIKLLGIQSGFTGLTPNATYFVQDAIGTIGTTAGTTSLPIGKAISSTEILIDRT